MVLVFVTQRSVQNFARGKFTLGVDASVAAGPVGRQGEAEAGISAEIYSYSRSRGLFAGVALDGTVLAFDRGANRAFYDGNERRHHRHDHERTGDARISEPARRFLAAVVAGTGASPARRPPPPGLRRRRLPPLRPPAHRHRPGSNAVRRPSRCRIATRAASRSRSNRAGAGRT